ncbi:MAG: hypothetical protein Q9160_002011 [Pyrenula sp. 1 TL-2023]
MELDSDERARLKRPADNDLEGEQRLTKRLGRLRIDPTNNRPIATVPPVSSDNDQLDRMPVDDTKDKIYIHDIDSELAELEEHQSEIAFIPEIEKKLAALPTSVLGSHRQDGNKQMVLYQVPSSISVSEEHDHVRKAIIATRARAREESVSEASLSFPKSETDQTRQRTTSEDRDVEAMDVD